MLRMCFVSLCVKLFISVGGGGGSLENGNKRTGNSCRLKGHLCPGDLSGTEAGRLLKSAQPIAGSTCGLTFLLVGCIITFFV